jgi:outer membrane protein
MKVWIFTTAILLGFTASLLGQRFAYVDVDRILNRIPDYQNAQKELDRVADEWRQLIAQEYDQIKGMYNRYQAEQVLLSESARKQREDEIMAKETQVRELQRQKFGAEGELFTRRQDLVRPIQERVYKAIEDFATQRSYDFILDRSTLGGILYSNPRYDVTEDIMRRLGID